MSPSPTHTPTVPSPTAHLPDSRVCKNPHSAQSYHRPSLGRSVFTLLSDIIWSPCSPTPYFIFLLFHPHWSFSFVPQTLQAYINLRAFALHVFSVWGALHSVLRGWLLPLQILTHMSSTPRGLPWCPIGPVFHHTSSQCPAYVLHAIYCCLNYLFV